MSDIGARQGESVYPLLFSLFLNDLTGFMSRAYNRITDICEISHLLFDNSNIIVWWGFFRGSEIWRLAGSKAC